MYGEMTYEKALENAEHLIALGQTTIYLHDENVPWAVASDVEVSGGYRLNGPVGMYVIAVVQGITFKWSVDFEQREANGRGYSLFDRDRLRDVARRLPEEARQKFATLLQEKVMPDLQKRTAELRHAMNKQIDSEDCVRGLIAFAEAREKAVA
jgi:hypothetical protein